MTSENQRKMFVKIGCERAISALDRNEGRPLSAEQLQIHLNESIDEGFTSRAIAIASLSGSALTPEQLSKLIDRCIQFEWFEDAIYASQQGSIPEETRERLLRVCIENNLAANRKEAEDLLTSD